MEKAFVSLVDTNRHYAKVSSDDIAFVQRKHVSIWKNDYTYVELYIEAKEDAMMDIDFGSSVGIVVEMFMLHETKAFIGHAGWYANNPRGIMPRGPKKNVEDILVPLSWGEKFYMHKGERRCVIAKISSKESIGSLEVVFDIMQNDILDKELFLDIEVQDIAMPKAEDYQFTVEYWHHPYNVAEYYGVEPWSSEHLDILREHQRLYKALGGRAVICTILDEVWGGQTYSKHDIRYPSMVKWMYSKREGWTFDYTDFDKWIALNRELGLDEKFVCYSMMPWGSKMRYYNVDKGKYITRTVPTTFAWRYKRAWTVFLDDFTRHLDELGIFDSIYIGFDERSSMGMVLDFLSKFVNKDGHHFKVAASFNNYLGNRKCLDRIDSVSVGLDEIKEHEKEYKEIALERAKEGKFTSLYTATEHFPNSFALSTPAESYWSIMYAYATGNNGFLRWAYDAWVEDPLVDTTHWSFQAGDCFMIYPNRETKKPSLSLRLMKLDEGVRDVNKLIILSQNTELAGRIAKMLQNICKNYSYDIAYDSSWGVSIRKAKWADDEGREEIIRDVANIEDSIANFTEEYLKFVKN